MQDAFGVVEPVNAEQDDIGLAQRLPDLLRPGLDVWAPGDLLQGRGVDGNGEGRGPDIAAARGIIGRDALAPPADGGALIAGRGIRYPDE